MIVTKLQGGLANQLFQWAATRNLAIKYNTSYFFDLRFFSKPATGPIPKRELELTKFNKLQINEIDTFDNLRKIKDRFNFYELPNNVYLDGYWQSEKYFKENENTIRNELSVDQSRLSYILNKYRVLNENTVSLHIRRGDYVNLQHIHPVQSLDYYNSAYDSINDTSVNVIVLSDDIEWCKSNIKFKNLTFVEQEDNVIDLYIMSLCKNNIIANSSFSWWGAWLNSNKDKKVIAPKEWFGKDSNINSSDICPETWEKL